MSGTTESDKGTLATRQPSAKEDKMIQDILCNYQLKPTEQTYSHYTEDAVFHDPVSIARGKESIQSQFNGMPRVSLIYLLFLCSMNIQLGAKLRGPASHLHCLLQWRLWISPSITTPTSYAPTPWISSYW